MDRVTSCEVGLSAAAYRQNEPIFDARDSWFPWIIGTRGMHLVVQWTESNDGRQVVESRMYNRVPLIHRRFQVVVHFFRSGIPAVGKTVSGWTEFF